MGGNPKRQRKKSISKWDLGPAQLCVEWFPPLLGFLSWAFFLGKSWSSHMHLRQAGCGPATMAKPIKIGFVSFLSKAADNIFSQFPSFLPCTRPVWPFVGRAASPSPLSHDDAGLLSPPPLLITQPTHVLISPLQHLFNYTHRAQVMQAASSWDAGLGPVPSLRVCLAPLLGHQAALVGTRGCMLRARPLPCTWPQWSPHCMIATCAGCL